MHKALHMFFAAVVAVFLACPHPIFAGEEFGRVAHRVAAGETIRSLILKNNCISTMLEYSRAREAFAQFNPAVPYSLELKPGSTVTVPASSGAAGSGCLAYREQKIVRIDFESNSLGEQIRVYLDGPVLPDLFVLKNTPVRVVCDFDGVQPAADLPRALECNGRMVQRVRVGYEEKPLKRARVVLDVNDKTVGRIEQEYFEKESLFLITVFSAVN